MRIYLNAQFASGNHRERLISVGMVSEIGEFYRIVRDNNAVQEASEVKWTREHVFSRLPVDLEGREWQWDTHHADYRNVISARGLADDLLDFVDAHPEPELWGWQSGFAYVLVRHLFGPLTARPDNFPAWCGELAAKWAEYGRPTLPPRGEGGHHALEQARWARMVDDILGR